MRTRCEVKTLLACCLLALVGCGGGASSAEATNLRAKVVSAHFVLIDPVDGLGAQASWIVGQQVERIQGETGIQIDVKSIRVIAQPPECDGVNFANVNFNSRVVQLRCLRQYAVREVTNRLDEWVHFYTPPFIVSDGTRRFGGLATGISELGTCGRINNATKCHPVTVTNLALQNSLGEYRIEHILEATEHEFGHIMGLEHRNEFVCKAPIAVTMHEAALAYCSPNSLQCLPNDRQSCDLRHSPIDVGRMLAQFKFIKRDRIAQRKKCRQAFSTRRCVLGCRKRIRFFRPQLENLPKLKSCNRRPTRGKNKYSAGVNIVETFIYE